MPDQGQQDGELMEGAEPKRRRAALANKKAGRAGGRRAGGMAKSGPMRLHLDVTPVDDDDDVGVSGPPAALPVAPLAGRAALRLRHVVVLLTFFLVVLVPTITTVVYLWKFAADEYHSNVGFSVRTEDTSPGIELLGGLTNISGSSTSDTDILYAYIQSQEMVEAIDKKLDLRTIWSKPVNDPFFSFSPDGSIEDLVNYWRSMVKVYYDASTRLIQIRVLAFDAPDAKKIAQAIVDNSTEMINQISAIAREDATRYARADLDQAIERLKSARQAMTQFRSRTQIVDPSADIQGQMGLLNTLETQLAQSLIDLDLLRDTTREGDPRIAQVQRRIDVIRSHIESERAKFGVGTGNETGSDYATLVAEFERLTVDRQFAEQAYTSALSAYDTASADAQRQSRYLATYVKPTLAQTSQYPQRNVLSLIVAVFCFLLWSVIVLIYYSVRDRV